MAVLLLLVLVLLLVVSLALAVLVIFWRGVFRNWTSPMSCSGWSVTLTTSLL